MFGYQEKPNFQVANEAEISKPPSVEFAPPAAGPGAAAPAGTPPRSN
jgi:LemA protein